MECRTRRGREINVLMYNSSTDSVSGTVAAVSVRAILFHAIQKAGSVKIPGHVMGLLEDGVPCMAWGTKSSVERLISQIRSLYPMTNITSLLIFEKTPVPILNSRYRDVEFSAVVFGPDKSIQPSVCPIHPVNPFPTLCEFHSKLGTREFKFFVFTQTVPAPLIVHM